MAARKRKVRWVDWYHEFVALARHAGVPPEEYEGSTGHGDEYVAAHFRDGQTPANALESIKDRQQRRARMGGSVVRARKQQHLPGIEPGVGPIEVVIPNRPMWEQIGGDMDPGTYGATIATADGDHIELIKIQPVREYVGDKEAKDVGFPFWTRTAWFDVNDLDPKSEDVRRALDSIGVELETLEEDFTPEQRAMMIAEALLDYSRADEGKSGWSGDIGIPTHVKWSDGTVAGSEYLADEDEAYRREVLLGDLEIDDESFGPDKNEPTNGLKIVTNGFTVEITEWTDIEAANGEEQPEGEKIVKRTTEVELDDLFDPKGKHRGSYSDDDKDVSLVELAEMDKETRERAVVAAAIAYIGYYGGDEEYVDAIGD
jgi:hypothetical protein